MSVEKFSRHSFFIPKYGGNLLYHYPNNRLTAYARVYPDLCRQTDDNETGGLSFEIQKDRFSFRLLPPCSDERKEKARACAEALNQSRKEL